MIIIDAPYLTYRAYCAGGVDAVAKASISVLLDLLARDSSVWLVWECRDRERGLGLRRAIYKDYKYNREPKPDEYYAATRQLQETATAMGISQAWPLDGEGDDAAWTLVVRATGISEPVTLWSRDKDWLQMLSWDISVAMLLPANGQREERLVTADDVVSLLGVPATAVAQYLALAGDPTDRVPGLPGIGHQRAVALLQACDQLVELVLSERGDDAVRRVAAVDQALAKHAQVVAERAELLRQMLDVVALYDVELLEQPGQYDPAAAAAALAASGCGWAIARLSEVAPDCWAEPRLDQDNWSE